MIFLCLAIVFSFVDCNNNAAFTETENKTIVAKDGTEYTFVGFEGKVSCFGEWDFIGRVEGEKKSFVHITSKIKTGMYSINGEQNVLGRYYPNNEFAAIYVRSDVLKTEIALDNCIRFGFVKDSLFNKDEAALSKKGIRKSYSPQDF